jgi:uncharacterized protein (TIGR02147 family)
MPNIYQYYDYHKFLLDAYEERKKTDTRFSYRFISQKVGIDAGYLVKVFQGQKNITTQSITSFAELLKLSERQAEYFALLLEFSKARSNDKIKSLFEKLLSYSPVDAKKVDSDKYEFYQKWYYTAVREIIGLKGFSGDYVNLAKSLLPPITLPEAKNAVQLLLRLGFIATKDKTNYNLVSRFITTGENWTSLAVRSFQEQTLELAIKALNTIPKSERDISTVTVTLSPEGLTAVREKLKTVRHEIMEIAQKEEAATRAYQLNLQIFPISKEFTGEKE